MSRVITNPPRRPLKDDGTVIGGWWHDTADGRIVCDLCPRECHLKPGDRGFCFVRENRDGEMVLSTYGRSTGFCIDPIEKKPLNHFYPGTSVLSFGTAGCNLGCKFCQNWSISKSREIRQLSELATPEMIATAAHEHQCKSVAYTYNDPVIWAEYAIDTARACRDRNIKNVAVTAGYITTAARASFFEYIDAANVDLKAFTEEFYQQLTLSHLQPVLDTLQWLHEETEVWFEITNLIIPRANDEDDEFRRMCDWILTHVGDEVPLHFSAFHPDFQLNDREATPIETLLRAYELAQNAGIKHVYVGNVNDVAHQSTYCPNCQQRVIERDWYQLGRYDLRGNQCGHCGHELAGHYQAQPGNWGRQRKPVEISRYGSQPPHVVEISGVEISNHPSTGEAEMSRSQSSTGAERGDVDRPELNAAQQQAAIRAVSESILAAVLNRPLELSDPTIAGAAEIPVFGCFVSIKRKQMLRGCCGYLGQRAPLAKAMLNSAKTSATGDARMPNISPTELPFLDFEIWLLYGQKAIESQGDDRVKEVVVGKHGLQIQQGHKRGLLLPGVATENDYNSESFLQQVCLKAGLSPTDWKEDNTQLATFEGNVIAGSFDRSLLSQDDPLHPRRFSDEEIEQMAAWCGHNVWATCRGAVPTYYMPGGSDGSVEGVNLKIEIHGREEPIQLARLSVRRGIPLQATLFQLCATAGQQLQIEEFSQLEITDLSVGLSVLYEPALQGNLAAPDLDGFQTEERALLVAQGAKSAWLYDPDKNVEEVLEFVAEQAQITLPENAALTSFRIQSNQIPASVVNVPTPIPDQTDRMPAVAGMFYPDDPEQLRQTVEDLTPTDPVERQHYRAALIPHAGLIYSGRIAADVLRRIEFPETIIMIGPKHTPEGVDWAVSPHASWLLPGGKIPSDPELVNVLADKIDGLELDAAAHQQEHAIEVELPLIAKFAPNSKVVGIAIGPTNFERCQAFAAGLAEVLENRLSKTLLVISSDMNHFASDAETRRVDELAINALEGLDAEKLFHTVRGNNISMCGVLPACMILETLKRLNSLTTAERIGYGTSADVSGDTSRVVGYAGMLFQ